MRLDKTTFKVVYSRVDKWTPSHDLARFKKAFATRAEITRTAQLNAASLGFAMTDIKLIVAAMTQGQFYKSMTSYHDNTQWQDVYHVPYDGLLLYVKFTTGIVTEFILLSLKEK